MSITVPLEGFGGGGTSLNFKVVAYATEAALLAATPKENTIGIITTTAINGWVFSATEPEPVEGMVWITTDTSSTVEFNSLKKNAVMVYPLSAAQYVDGAWVDVPAMSYQGGEWSMWRYIILGNSKNLLGVPTLSNSNDTGSSYNSDVTLKPNEDGTFSFNIHLPSNSWSTTTASFPNTIERSNKNTLFIRLRIDSCTYYNLDAGRGLYVRVIDESNQVVTTATILNSTTNISCITSHVFFNVLVDISNATNNISLQFYYKEEGNCYINTTIEYIELK